MANNSEKVYLKFSENQMWNERSGVTRDGKEFTTVNVSFPSSSKYKDWHLNLNTKRIGQSKFNSQRFVSFDDPDIELTAHKYDKTTKTESLQKMKVSEIQKEFDSWRGKSISEKISDAQQRADDQNKNPSSGRNAKKRDDVSRG